MHDCVYAGPIRPIIIILHMFNRNTCVTSSSNSSSCIQMSVRGGSQRGHYRVAWRLLRWSRDIAMTSSREQPRCSVLCRSSTDVPCDLRMTPIRSQVLSSFEAERCKRVRPPLYLNMHDHSPLHEHNINTARESSSFTTVIVVIRQHHHQNHFVYTDQNNRQEPRLSLRGRAMSRVTQILAT